MKQNKLGEILLREKVISDQQLKKAQELQKQSGGRLGFNLAKLGFVKESSGRSRELEVYAITGRRPFCRPE